MADGEVAVDLAEKVVGLSVGGREEPQLLAAGNEQWHPDGGKVREEPRLSKKCVPSPPSCAIQEAIC